MQALRIAGGRPAELQREVLVVGCFGIGVFSEHGRLFADKDKTAHEQNVETAEPIYRELLFRCASTLFWHSLAVDSNWLNSGVPRSFANNGSDRRLE